MVNDGWLVVYWLVVSNGIPVYPMRLGIVKPVSSMNWSRTGWWYTGIPTPLKNMKVSRDVDK